MNTLLFIITIIAVFVSIFCLSNKIKVDNKIKAENNNLKQENERLSLEEENLIKSIEKDKQHLSTIQQELKSSLDNQKQLSQEAFEQYIKILESSYKEKEDEWDMYTDAMQTAYSNLQLKLMREADECREDLDKIRATRAAAIEAQRREREIEDNLSLYCFTISDADKADIAKLEALKPSLNKPRVLSMLIWQTWFRDSLKTLSANIIGLNDKTGIYKITNIKTKECYIGQAVSIKDRWTEHVKCGLGIDTPANNKLYKAMQEFGVWNFSFEVIEECPRDQLNEKEKYYIELYNSCDLGYNLNRGIGK